jgi:hypothetical protein
VRVKPPLVLRTWSKRLAETKGHKRARGAVARWQPIILQEQFMGVWQKIMCPPDTSSGEIAFRLLKFSVQSLRTGAMGGKRSYKLSCPDGHYWIDGGLIALELRYEYPIRFNNKVY